MEGVLTSEVHLYCLETSDRELHAVCLFFAFYFKVIVFKLFSNTDILGHQGQKIFDII